MRIFLSVGLTVAIMMLLITAIRTVVSWDQIPTGIVGRIPLAFGIILVAAGLSGLAVFLCEKWKNCRRLKS